MFKIQKKRLIPAFVFAVLLLAFSSFIPSLRKPLLDVLRFPLTIVNLLRREVSGMIFYHRNFVQNEKLKARIDFLKQQVNAGIENQQENARLKKLLDFKAQAPYKVIAARVIARDPSNWSAALIVDRGSVDAIKKDCVAITFLGLVGRVVEVNSLTSKILLINDPNLSVSAITQRSRQEGLVSGSLGGTLLMKYLPKDADLKREDLVITSGLTKAYPKGLLIGKIIDVGEEFSGLSKYAIIKPAVELANLEEVLIIIP